MRVHEVHGHLVVTLGLWELVADDGGKARWWAPDGPPRAVTV